MEHQTLLDHGLIHTDDMLVKIRNITEVRCDKERCLVTYAGLRSTCSRNKYPEAYRDLSNDRYLSYRNVHVDGGEFSNKPYKPSSGQSKKSAAKKYLPSDASVSSVSCHGSTCQIKYNTSRSKYDKFKTVRRNKIDGKAI